MNKILELDNGHIGIVQDIRKAYREEISHQALNDDLDEEEIKYNINLILDLLVDIQDLEEDTLIKVVYNPMGAYQHTIYEEKRSR